LGLALEGLKPEEIEAALWRQLEARGVEASVRLLGKEHPDTLRAMLNLAHMR